ncbi:signal transduction histidine kinase [Actinoplanes campanulatus]|uniref:histidine kinase n=1 Tax=Actinoplanes campanulatus TaxID=113559 RepID=A0A7W5FJS6_9ACTN|nr:histidine kinase [Actinoplanes campanulatus]MBB3100825.1 signal transduction histidine kinase [Actinoplanes campanulatus]GGN46445.1 two-component sensor histidine kinase [Actinoplanes campanulatus]GID41264.1 two-component sensor histidine kinase [Actinoplanes campanulatus]
MSSVADLRDQWRRLDVTVQDLPVALLLTALALVPAWHRHGTQLADLVPARPFGVWGVLAITVECLPLAIRRKRPVTCLALVFTGFAADQLCGWNTLGGTALSIALISAGIHVAHHRRATMIVASAGFLALAAVLARAGQLGFDVVALFYALLASMWAVGAGMRRTRLAEMERRRHAEETARAAERTRIARELHDVVTHHVTAMVVQAEAARYLTAAPERLDEALTAVSDTGRHAITDLRHLLDLLNPAHGDELRVLVEQTRRAGQPVELVEQGSSPGTPGGAGATVYRVAQEALTNALKYDHGARTSVTVRYGVGEIDVRVSTDGSGSSTASPGGSGRGLAGLRERVGTLGGDFTAGPRAEGGFLVTARIPVGVGA